MSRAKYQATGVGHGVIGGSLSDHQQANLRICRVGQILRGSGSATQGKLHIGLAGRDPHIADHDVVERNRLLRNGIGSGARNPLDGELKRSTRRTWLEVDAPMAERVCLGSASLAAKGDCDRLTRRGVAPYVYRQIALDDHMAGENSGQSYLR
jgi:hypothetical protein